MEPTTMAFVGTIAGVVVGAGASIGTTLLQLRHTSRRETAAQQLASTERAREFQRQTIVATQDALRELYVCASRVVAECDATPKWHDAVVSSEVGEAFAAAITTALALTERISDTEARRIAKEVCQLCAEIFGSNTRGAAKSLVESLMSQHMQAQAKLGEALRGLYPPSPHGI